MSVHIRVFCCVQQKILFRRSFFLYSPCPYLEGIKDALCYKFRRLTIGQNCSAVCTNKGGHRDAFSNEQCKALCVSRGMLNRPLSLKRSKKRDLFFVVLWWQIRCLSRARTSPYIHYSGEFKHLWFKQLLLLLTCIKGCGLRNNKFKVHVAACTLY